jgi:hypothetical protein
MPAEYVEPTRPPVDISEIQNEALEVYEAEPTPQTMLEILGVMIESMGDVIAMRNSVTDKEARLALRPMDREMDEFFDRVADYKVTLRAFAGEYGITKVYEYHDAGSGELSVDDVPRIYNELVVKPILKGNASSTYHEYPWSKVVFPDVIAPAMFANRIAALDPGMFDFGTQVRFLAYDALRWIGDKAEPEVKRFFKAKSAEYANLAKEEALDKIPAIVAAAEEKIREAAHEAAEVGARKGAKKAVTPMILFAVGLSAIALMRK